MKTNYQQLLIRQLSGRLRSLSRPDLREVPSKGWIRSLREALAMSHYQLAKRIRVSQPTVVNWEQREAKGTITLNSLKKVADAMQCDLVYALVPRKPLEKILKDRALQVASASVEQVAHSMGLEDQRTSAAHRKTVLKQTARRLLEDKPRRLWDS